MAATKFAFTRVIVVKSVSVAGIVCVVEATSTWVAVCQKRVRSYVCLGEGYPNLVNWTVLLGASSVMVVFVIPRQEHALEYRAAPEQCKAYAGTFEGTLVAWRFASHVTVILTTSVSVKNNVNVVR